MRRSILSASVALVLVTGCSLLSSNTTTLNPAPTRVTVDPASFRGDVTCGDVPGAMRSYVAALRDVCTGETFVSGLTPCTSTVSFFGVVAGHGYVADVQGFDVAAAPAGGAPAPLWSTHCGPDDTSAAACVDATDAGLEAGAVFYGYPDAGDVWPVTAAIEYDEVRVKGCRPLSAATPATTGSVDVSLAAALGALTCGDAAGQIATFVATPRDAASPPATASCADHLTFTTSLGATQRFDVLAFEHGSAAATWGATCSAEPRAGTTVPATCTGLSSEGAVRLPLAALAAEASTSCDEIAGVEVAIAGPETRDATLACGGDAFVRDLAPGEYTLRVTLARTSGASIVRACAATVAPGLVATAACATP